MQNMQNTQAIPSSSTDSSSGIHELRVAWHIPMMSRPALNARSILTDELIYINAEC